MGRPRERSWRCCRDCSGIAQSLPLNQGLLSTGWAAVSAGQSRTRTQGLHGHGGSGNAPSQLQSKSGGTAQTLCTPKKGKTDPKCIQHGARMLIQVILLCRAQLPQAAETKTPLILPSHKKLQQRRALRGAGVHLCKQQTTPPAQLPPLPIPPKSPFGHQQPTLTRPCRPWKGLSINPQHLPGEIGPVPSAKGHSCFPGVSESPQNPSRHPGQGAVGAAGISAARRLCSPRREGGTPCKVISLCTFTLPATRSPPAASHGSLST